MKKLLYSIIAVLILGSCQQQDGITKNHSDAHWGYSEKEGPNHWAELSDEFIKCAEGHAQSPIDLESYAAQKEHGTLLDFNYHPSPVDMVNNGHTIQANPEEVNELLVDGHSYLLQQLHFHAPAEHQIDGIIYPMEIHLVHKDSAGKLGVLGWFVKEGKENEYLQVLWDKFPTHIEEHAHPNKRCDLLHLIPEDHHVFHYSGSLTTPPCSEGVEWMVMQNPIELSKAQIKQFKKLYNGNNRPIQKLDGRQVGILE